MRCLLAAALFLGLAACAPSRTPASPAPAERCALLSGLLLEAEYQSDPLARNDAMWRAWNLFYLEKVGDPATSAAYAVAEALTSSDKSALQRARERIAKQCPPK